MHQLLIVALGGAAGASCRYLVGLACLRYLGDRFAFGTLLVNVAGCFLIGTLMHMAQAHPSRLPVLPHLGATVGFLGGLTTFSTFGYETVLYIEEQKWLLAGANVLANVILGLLAAYVGLVCWRWWGG